MRRWPWVLVLLVALGSVAAYTGRPLLELLVERDELNVFAGLVRQRLGFELEPAPPPPVAAPGQSIEQPTRIELDTSIRPFLQIGDRLGPRGLGNDFITSRGAAIFDANGDGRLDLYLPQSGRPVAKATDDEHVLGDEFVPAQPSTLFLNTGNAVDGTPILKSVEELERGGNAELVRQELLIENKYRPRESADEDPTGPGRIALGAVAADFNADGRLDLYVLNFHHGVMAQIPELGVRAYPAPNNLGRGARDAREALVVTFPPFLRGERSDGLHETVEFDGKTEREGRNSLYLNLGDRDGDGIPEWEDATEALGVGGHRASATATVADFDRDGDLDLYVGNFLDPDFWGFGLDKFAGNLNQLYVNQLADSGELGFLERAAELGVSGMHGRDGLESGVWFPSRGEFVAPSVEIVEGRQVGEEADHSWAVSFNDWNRDGWPDLVVANDIGNRLRVYENLKGARFRYVEAFNDPLWDGCWMGLSVGDLDGDTEEELLAINCGGQVMSVRNNALWLEDTREATLMALSVLNYPTGHSTMHHALLRYRPGAGFEELATQVRVHHSPYIPPDASIRANFAPRFASLYDEKNFATSLTSYEFAFNAAMLDVENDGDLDLYFAGSLSRGNDDFIGDWSGCPGRLLVNESNVGEFIFRDRTIEYQLLDIAHMDYSSNPPRRPSPGTGWHKRDYIYLTDTDSYAGMGVEASRTAIHDIFRMHEAAFGVLSGDLNGDGFEDLVVTHTGGYTSLSPEARNMQVEFLGRRLAVPAPNKLIKAPTNFEGGPTFVYINQGLPPEKVGHWVKLRLIDRSSHNRHGVGGRVLVNGKIARRVQIGGNSFGTTTGPLHVGLGAASAHSLEIDWPSGDHSVQRVTLDPPVTDATICVDREQGVVPCEPSG